MSATADAASASGYVRLIDGVASSATDADSHALGFTMWQLGHSAPADAVAEEALRAIGSGDYPYLVEHAGEHERESDPTAFEFGLDLIFDGLRRMRA